MSGLEPVHLLATTASPLPLCRPVLCSCCCFILRPPTVVTESLKRTANSITTFTLTLQTTTYDLFDTELTSSQGGTTCLTLFLVFRSSSFPSRAFNWVESSSFSHSFSSTTACEPPGTLREASPHQHHSPGGGHWGRGQERELSLRSPAPAVVPVGGETCGFSAPISWHALPTSFPACSSSSCVLVCANWASRAEALSCSFCSRTRRFPASLLASSRRFTISGTRCASSSLWLSASLTGRPCPPPASPGCGSPCPAFGGSQSQPADWCSLPPVPPGFL